MFIVVSPLKGLTRAQITANAAKRRAELAAKKGKRKTKTKAKKVKVSQATINKIKSMGKAAALKAAASPTATAEFKEGVRRYYGGDAPRTVRKSRKPSKTKPKVISGMSGRTRAV